MILNGLRKEEEEEEDIFFFSFLNLGVYEIWIWCCRQTQHWLTMVIQRSKHQSHPRSWPTNAAVEPLHPDHPQLQLQTQTQTQLQQ